MSTRIMVLATRIARNTSLINSYYLEHGLPTPSFDVDGPRDVSIPEGDAESARVAVIDDTLELQRLVLGPRDYLMSYTHDDLISQQAITRYGIAHVFPVGQEASFGDISHATGLKEGLVGRILHHAITRNIFLEPRPGIIAHNAVSRLLVEDPIIHDWVATSTDELWQAAAQTCNAVDKWPGSEEPNETGFALANNTNLPIYEELSRFPDRARRFGNSMRAFTESAGFELHHVVDNFPWAKSREGTIVDVGGSQGFVSFAIAREFPLLSCVVQDLEPVVSEAKKSIPADVDGRVHFTTHDFFTEQPAIGADIYFFRWILHNWSDKYARRILRMLVPALKEGAKIVIIDSILPEPGVLSRWQENRVRTVDLTMTELQNSYERDVSAWAKLLDAADSRFILRWTKTPVGSSLGFVVAEWKDSVPAHEA